MPINYNRRFENDSRAWVLADYNFEQKFQDFFDKVDNQVVRCFVLYHWLYCCATAPIIEVFFDTEDIREYIFNKKDLIKAGDIIEIFPVYDDKNVFNHKVPDQNNLIPEKGAY